MTIPLYGHAFVDASGHFSIDNIAPGDYKLFAWEDPAPHTYFDPEFLRPVEDKGAPVNIEESSKKKIDVRRIPWQSD